MTVRRSSFFIDGFNLYHSIKDAGGDYARVRDFQKYKWLNLWAFCEKFITKSEQINNVYYFTAYANWKPESASRHRAYVAANTVLGCTPIFGKFVEKPRYSLVPCHQPCVASNNKKKCGKQFISHEEKQTDVNIAVHLLKCCVQGGCDAVYLISGDNDLIPALTTAHELCPSIDIRIVIPPTRHYKNIIAASKNNGFKYTRINETHLEKSLLPLSVQDGDKIYTCPPQWQ